MNIYQNGRFIALAGKIPAYPGNWREINVGYGEAKRRLESGGNIGYVIPQDQIVIDVDPRNGGAESYENLLDDIGFPELSTIYPAVLTGGGGLHIYCTISDPAKLAAHSHKYPGIDIKKHGGYVVAAGSVHPETGKQYLVINNPGTIKRAAPAIIEAFGRKESEKRKEAAAELSTDDLALYLSKLDVTLFNTNEMWFPLLCAAYNATGGAGLDVFISWCLGDPKYADRENEIRYRWNSLHNVDNPITAATLYAALDPADLRAIQAARAFDPLPNEAAVREACGAYDPTSDQAYQVAIETLKRHKIVSGSDQRLWEYRGTHWRPLGENMARRYVFQVAAGMAEKGKSITSILGAAASLLPALTAVDYTPGAVNPEGHSIINTLSGEVWVDDRTGSTQLRPHNPESALVSCLPIKFDPAAKAPRFTRFLNEVFPGDTETQRHLLEVLGYAVQGRKNIATWVLFHGRGANGKTVLLSILSALLGEAALEKPIESISVERNNHALADLPGKLAIIDDDVSSRTILPDGELKSLSENKWLTANPKHATPFRFRACAIPILSANSFPVARDLSDGLKRRAQVFQFIRQFAPDEQDTGLTDYIVKHEMPGILNMLLSGLRRLRARGMYDAPAPCIMARDRWYETNNPVVQFVRRYIDQSKPGRTPVENIWYSYRGFAENSGMKRPMTAQQFTAALEAAGIETIEDRETGIKKALCRLRSKPNAVID